MEFYYIMIDSKTKHYTENEHKDECLIYAFSVLKNK